jgi:hypothetical protein
MFVSSRNPSHTKNWKLTRFVQFAPIVIQGSARLHLRARASTPPTPQTIQNAAMAVNSLKCAVFGVNLAKNQKTDNFERASAVMKRRSAAYLR